MSRAALVAVTSIIAAASLAAIAWGVSQTNWYRAIGQKDEDLVTATVIPFASKCDEPLRPLLVEMRNDSDRYVKSAALSIGVYDRGDSRDRAERGQPDWTYIVPPHGSTLACFSIPLAHGAPVPDRPVVTVTVGPVNFFERGEPVPR